MVTKGQKFVLNGRRYQVVHVSELRAHCRALTVTTVTVIGRGGRVRRFRARSTSTIDISPGTPLELLAEFEKGAFL